MKRTGTTGTRLENWELGRVHGPRNLLRNSHHCSIPKQLFSARVYFSRGQVGHEVKKRAVLEGTKYRIVNKLALEGNLSLCYRRCQRLLLPGIRPPSPRFSLASVRLLAHLAQEKDL